MSMPIATRLLLSHVTPPSLLAVSIFKRNTTKHISNFSTICCCLNSTQSSPMAYNNTIRSCKVAVIGAGAAGLVAARELEREGHEIVVFEQSDKVGGTWVYESEVESDPLGLDPTRTVVHSSMYWSLRTNLPRELMSFIDYPFKVVEGRDCRRFPGHREVALYLQDFAVDFDLLRFIRFRTKVEYVGRDDKDESKWTVRSWCGGELKEEVYDAVVVCNGHYTYPKVAEIPGIDKWSGKQIHSHNYRVPDPFRDEVVVIIGYSASGEDIARELAGVAKEVHISARSAKLEVTTTNAVDGPGNYLLHTVIKCLCQDGTVNFEGGTSIIADSIIHCTGYYYHFPFLDTKGILTVNDNCVGPLYEHVFPPSLAPSLSFVGLPWKVVPFPLCELQSKWIACALSGKAILPSDKDMMEAVKDFYARNEAAGRPKHYTHNIGYYQDWAKVELGVLSSIFIVIGSWRLVWILCTVLGCMSDLLIDGAPRRQLLILNMLFLLPRGLQKYQNLGELNVDTKSCCYHLGLGFGGGTNQN